MLKFYIQNTVVFLFFILNLIFIYVFLVKSLFYSKIMNYIYFKHTKPTFSFELRLSSLSICIVLHGSKQKVTPHKQKVYRLKKKQTKHTNWRYFYDFPQFNMIITWICKQSFILFISILLSNKPAVIAKAFSIKTQAAFIL